MNIRPAIPVASTGQFFLRPIQAARGAAIHTMLKFTVRKKYSVPM